jgi:hypothetical protein
MPHTDPKLHDIFCTVRPVPTLAYGRESPKRLELVVPNPSCPSALLPQHLTKLLSRIPQAKLCPTFNCVTVLPVPRFANGRKFPISFALSPQFALVTKPRLENVGRPQHLTILFPSNAHV